MYTVVLVVELCARKRNPASHPCTPSACFAAVTSYLRLERETESLLYPSLITCLSLDSCVVIVGEIIVLRWRFKRLPNEEANLSYLFGRNFLAGISSESPSNHC